VRNRSLEAIFALSDFTFDSGTPSGGLSQLIIGGQEAAQTLVFDFFPNSVQPRPPP
jgi:hypothetical protein